MFCLPKTRLASDLETWSVRSRPGDSPGGATRRALGPEKSGGSREELLGFETAKAVIASGGQKSLEEFSFLCKERIPWKVIVTR